MSTRLLFPALVFVFLAVGPAAAQVAMRPTPAPQVTAENEEWYTSGLPIAFGGAVYHPSGPITHFLHHEMVPAGTFESVTVYVRTTVEPGSMIYVPLSGGLVRPYERRRSGDLAGTVGSTAPRFPVSLSADPAPIAPGGVQTPSAEGEERPVAAIGAAAGIGRAGAPLRTVGSGGVPMSQLPVVRPPRFTTAGRPAGINALFVEYDGERWFAAGRAIELGSAPLSRVGEYHGFDVYAQPGLPDTIFVASLPGGSALVTPYRAR